MSKKFGNWLCFLCGPFCLDILFQQNFHNTKHMTKFDINFTRIVFTTDETKPLKSVCKPAPKCLFWGPFPESPGNFSGPKSNIEIEIKRIRARVLAKKLLHFVSLTDSFIMLDAKLLKPRSLVQTETAYRAP